MSSVNEKPKYSMINVTKGHTVRKYDTELDNVRGRTLAMGGQVRMQVLKAITALEEGNIDLAREVVDREHKIDHCELDIDEAIFNLIAKRQPVGRDLRFILALSKVAGDLERAGDRAACIAWCVIRLMEQAVQPLSPKISPHIRKLDRVVRGLLERSLNALTRTDVDVAFDVLQAGLQLDSGFEAAINRVMSCVSEDVRRLDQVPNLVFILRALASIGDLASNIAEQVIFVIEGRDVRYQNKASLIDALRKREDH